MASMCFESPYLQWTEAKWMKVGVRRLRSQEAGGSDPFRPPPPLNKTKVVEQKAYRT